ncbi:MAG: hypothetical protein DRI79_11865 [Chloroflexi bacterium]|mgnify:CR=1 FL=1|nr:MAG: hypothetical protein DRI79_11865 [Chloroflexota bacterium]
MSKRVLIIITGAVLCALLSGVALANGTPAIDWHVIGGGGGHMEAGIHSLDGTIGQALVGRVANSTYDLCSGFWCGAAAGFRVYLPLVLRGWGG